MEGYSKVLLLLISNASLRMVNWVLVRQEFCGFNLNDIILNWEAISGFMGAGKREAWIFFLLIFRHKQTASGFFEIYCKWSGKWQAASIWYWRHSLKL